MTSLSTFSQKQSGNDVTSPKWHVRTNSFFEHSHLPIDVWVCVIDGWLNEHSSKVRFLSAVEK